MNNPAHAGLVGSIAQPRVRVCSPATARTEGGPLHVLPSPFVSQNRMAIGPRASGAGRHGCWYPSYLPFEHRIRRPVLGAWRRGQ
jgi:hypothetical protein